MQHVESSFEQRLSVFNNVFLQMETWKSVIVFCNRLCVVASIWSSECNCRRSVWFPSRHILHTSSKEKHYLKLAILCLEWKYDYFWKIFNDWKVKSKLIWIKMSNQIVQNLFSGCYEKNTFFKEQIEWIRYVSSKEW